MAYLGLMAKLLSYAFSLCFWLLVLAGDFALFFWLEFLAYVFGLNFWTLLFKLCLALG